MLAKVCEGTSLINDLRMALPPDPIGEGSTRILYFLVSMRFGFQSRAGTFVRMDFLGNQCKGNRGIYFFHFPFLLKKKKQKTKNNNKKTVVMYLYFFFFLLEPICCLLQDFEVIRLGLKFGP